MAQSWRNLRASQSASSFETRCFASLLRMRPGNSRRAGAALLFDRRGRAGISNPRSPKIEGSGAPKGATHSQPRFHAAASVRGRHAFRRSTCGFATARRRNGSTPVPHFPELARGYPHSACPGSHGGRNAARSVSGASRARACEARAQAPRPAGSLRPPHEATAHLRRASQVRSTIKTPLDSAPR